MDVLTPHTPTLCTNPAFGRIHLFIHFCTHSGRGVFVFQRLINFLSIVLAYESVFTEFGRKVKTGRIADGLRVLTKQMASARGAAWEGAETGCADSPHPQTLHQPCSS